MREKSPTVPLERTETPSSVAPWPIHTSRSSRQSVMRQSRPMLPCAERAANDVISHTGQILHSAATNKHDAVFLQIVSDSRNVNSTFHLVYKTNSGNLTKCRVRLLGRSGGNRKTNTSLLRIVFEYRTKRLILYLLSALSDQLVNRRHYYSTSFFKIVLPTPKK